MLKWTELNMEESDGTVLENDELKHKLLNEFRQTGSIFDYFFTPLEGQSTEPEDAWEAGPKTPEDVDWTGF